MYKQTFIINGLKICSYEFDIIDSLTYLVTENDNAIVIDPHIDNDLLSDIKDIKEITVVLTHEHFDHISGVEWLRTYKKIKVIASRSCVTKINSDKNGTELFPLLFIHDKEKYQFIKKSFNLPFHCIIDEKFCGSHSFMFFNHRVKLFETPGHTLSSISIIIDDKILFAGDNLLGNGQELKSVDADIDSYQSTLRIYKKLDEKMIVFPGHGDPQSISWFLERL